MDFTWRSLPVFERNGKKILKLLGGTYCSSTYFFNSICNGSSCKCTQQEFTPFIHFVQFILSSILGRVPELLINFENASTSSLFEENVERFLCLWFSITQIHYPILFHFDLMPTLFSSMFFKSVYDCSSCKHTENNFTEFHN